MAWLFDPRNAVLLTAVAYVLLRLSWYGVHRGDKVILRTLGGLAAATVPAFFCIDSVLASGLVVGVLSLFVILAWLGGAPGVRIELPQGAARRRIVFEISLVVLAALITRFLID